MDVAGKFTPTGKHILLVEDHEDSAEMLTILLQAEGYQVRWVSTAAAALAAVREEGGRPDVVLLDLTLPDSDGLELGRVLQRSPGAPPIIVMSAKSAHIVESAARSISAAGFVRKPFTTHSLIDSITQALTA